MCPKPERLQLPAVALVTVWAVVAVWLPGTGPAKLFVVPGHMLLGDAPMGGAHLVGVLGCGGIVYCGACVCILAVMGWGRRTPQ